LHQRHTGRDFTESLLERTVAFQRLAPADRGLCQELVYGVVRWQATLDWLIVQKTAGRPQKAALQDLLRLGLYQIFWLDRIPPHAAVNETVEQARQSGFGPQSGFINAVLRGYLRESEATRHSLAALKTADPAIGWSHPEWLVTRWQPTIGASATQQLLAWNNTPPKTFARINVLKTSAEKILPQWRDEDVAYDFVRRDWLPENLVFELKSHPPLAALPSFQQGLFYVQDPSTLLAVAELGPAPDEAVLDFCAAPGGKATFIAQQMTDRGEVVAADAAPERLKLITENCRRLGLGCVRTMSTTEAERLGRSFDRVLVDAPCSNTGVLRRRVDLRWRLKPDELERLRTLQLELLTRAARCLRPGGTLVYSTCSLEAEENTDLISQFAAAHPGFRLVRQRALTPWQDGVDGAFVAAFRNHAP
jgi:16S rRNA (cytosine967-C5)-methyltransferase